MWLESLQSSGKRYVNLGNSPAEHHRADHQSLEGSALEDKQTSEVSADLRGLEFFMCLRCGYMGCPHLEQKLVPSRNWAPQCRQKRGWRAGVSGVWGRPQAGQNRAPARIAAPQDWQRIG